MTDASVTRVRRLFACWLAAACTIGFAPQLASEVTGNQAVALLSGREETVDLSTAVALLRDPDGAMQLQDAQAASAAGRFAVARPNNGFDPAPMWVRLRLHNASSNQVTRWLALGNYQVLYVDMYAPEVDGSYRLQRGGAGRPFDSRPIAVPDSVFELQLPPARTAEVFVRLHSPGLRLQFQPTLWKPDAYRRHLQPQVDSWLVYVGVVSALALFNLLLFVALRDLNYLLYVGCAVSVALTLSCTRGSMGAAFQYLWPDWPALNGVMNFLAPGLAPALIAMFMARLVALREHLPRAYKLLAGLAFLLAGLVVVLIVDVLAGGRALGAGRYLVPVNSFLVLAIIGTLFYVLVVRAMDGHRTARILCIAWLPLLAASAAVGYSFAIGSPTPHLTVMWASGWELVFMSLALADRFNEERKAKLRAQAQLVQTLQASERELEGKVAERTHQLQRSYQVVEAQRSELAAWNTQLEARVQSGVAEIERLSHLKRFFSPAVSSLILAGEVDPLKSRRKEITVVFLDLRGFTAFTESADPEEVMSVLREYHAAMGRLIVAYNGTVEHFAGDGIMIFFNDPIELPDPGLQAVKMAIEMQHVFAECEQRWRKLGHQLGMGIGIAQGYATIGAIGFEGRLDYGAVGAVCNLAARICSEAAARQILVQERVLARLDEQFTTEDVPELTLKGVPRPVQVRNVRSQAAAEA